MTILAPICNPLLLSFPLYFSPPSTPPIVVLQFSINISECTLMYTKQKIQAGQVWGQREKERWEDGLRKGRHHHQSSTDFCSWLSFPKRPNSTVFTKMTQSEKSKRLSKKSIEIESQIIAIIFTFKYYEKGLLKIQEIWSLKVFFFVDIFSFRSMTDTAF